MGNCLKNNKQIVWPFMGIVDRLGIPNDTKGESMGTILTRDVF